MHLITALGEYFSHDECRTNDTADEYVWNSQSSFKYGWNADKAVACNVLHLSFSLGPE
jgi:hypothetical protein